MNSRKSLIVLTAAGLLVGSLGVVGAQSTQSGGADTQSQTQSETQDSSQTLSQTQRLRGFGHGFGDNFRDDFGRGFGGLPLRHLALGTTVKLEFYTGDPGAAGSTATPTQTLTFTYGQDSEAAFAQSFAEARANASYLTVNVGEQTQTLELPGADTASDTSFGRGNRRGGVYGALPLGGLNEGSSVQAIFYGGDPEANGEELQTLTFTYGQDSEAGFADAFASAAQNAAYVSVTTSPQTYTVNLSAVPNRGFAGRGGFDGRFDGRFDGQIDDQFGSGFRGGFGRGGSGHRR